MRISALGALLKSNFKLQACAHQSACSRAVACSLALPPRKRTRRVDPFIQVFPIGAMARSPPRVRMVRCGRMNSAGNTRSIQTFGLSAMICFSFQTSIATDPRRSKLYSNPHPGDCERDLPRECGNVDRLPAHVRAAAAIGNFGLPWTVNNGVCAGRLRSMAVELAAKYPR